VSDPCFSSCVSSSVVRVLVLGAIVVAAMAPLAGAQGPITIAADERIGSFRVKSDGTLGGAISAFGAPSALRQTSDVTCTATWRRPSLTIFFYNLGGGDPCTRRFGLFGRAIARGAAWRTTKGLRVGDPVARVRALYRSARFRRGTRGFWPAGWWLVPRANRFGLGSSYPGLLAETRAGRVTAFHVRYQKGGD
jgi:hypothetical protein